jgi:hypothetical protein
MGAGRCLPLRSWVAPALCKLRPTQTPASDPALVLALLNRQRTEFTPYCSQVAGSLGTFPERMAKPGDEVAHWTRGRASDPDQPL